MTFIYLYVSELIFKMYSWELDDDDEEENVKDSYAGIQLVIFLIEATKGMMKKLPGEEEDMTGVQKSLSCVTAMMKNKVFSSPKDCVAVLTFGNSPSSSTNAGEFETVRQVMELSVPSSSNIRLLESLTDGEAGSQKFESKYQPGESSNIRLSEALWQCQTVMSSYKGKVGNKSIVLMTNNDDPHVCDDRTSADSRKLDSMARNKAGDLHSQNIFLDVIPVIPPGGTFRTNKFYSDLMKLADGTAPLNSTTADLANTLIRRTNVKRSNGKYLFDLGGVTIGVSAYNLVSQRKKPFKQKLTADHNEPVKSKRMWVDPATERPLLPSEMNRFITYGGKAIKFTQDEFKSMNTIEPNAKALQLFGFKPVSSLKYSKYIRSSHFLYPHDQLVEGSRPVFAALLSSCLKRDVMAVCKFKSRPSAGVNFVGLVPQEEKKAEDGQQLEPPGFHVVYLLYADDQRPVPLVDNKVEVDPEAVETAKQIISKLKLKHFTPVENCAIQTQYNLIEAHALRREEVYKPEDDTLPDLERMERKLGDKSSIFLSQVYDDDYNPEGPAGKVAKKETESKSLPLTGDSIDMEEVVRKGSVGKLTVDTLKNWLKSKGISVTKLKKAELVDLVQKEYQ